MLIQATIEISGADPDLSLEIPPSSSSCVDYADLYPFSKSETEWQPVPRRNSQWILPRSGMLVLMVSTSSASLQRLFILCLTT